MKAQKPNQSRHGIPVQRRRSEALRPTLLLALVTGLFFVLPGCFTFGAEEQKETLSVSDTDVNWLEFEVDTEIFVDELEINGQTGAGVVTAIARLSALTSGDDTSVFDDFVMTLNSRPPVVELNAEYEGSRAEQVRVDRFEITVDNRMLVRLRKPSADRVELNDTGAVDAVLGSQDIDLNRTGFFVVDTDSGNVEALTVEEGDIITDNGNIRLEVIEPIPEGEIFIQSRSGDIDIRLPRGYGWVFDFDSLGSPIDFSVGPESFFVERGNEYVDRFSVNRGGMLITIISDTGSITVYD